MTEKIRPNDPRILNDIDNASSEAKAYHDMRASEEARKLAERYKHSPAYLKLLALHINATADKAYSTHMKALEASKPKKRETQEINENDGLFDND